MPESDSEQSGARTAPYLAFPTFLTALDRLAPEPPHVLDKRIYSSFSGAVQGQIVGAFRFLGLIDDITNEVNIGLEKLVKSSESDKKKELRNILQNSYPDIFNLSLVKATPKQVEGLFEQNYFVWGDTCRKAVTFFIKAAQYCDIPLSTYLTSRKGRSGRKKNGIRSKSATTQKQDVGPEQATQDTKPNTQKTTRFLTLQTGDAEIGLTVKFDPFTISEADRKYVFAFIDKMNAYKPVPEQRVEDDTDSFAGMRVSDDDVPF